MSKGSATRRCRGCGRPIETYADGRRRLCGSCLQLRLLERDRLLADVNAELLAEGRKPLTPDLGRDR